MSADPTTVGRCGSRNPAARTDSARLDWLDTFAESIDRYQGPPVRWRVWCDEPGMVDEPHGGPSLRAAIDAAMTAMEGIDASGD
jgi:hypothetical protein